MATRMEEFFFRRMASRGESPMATTSVAGAISARARIASGQDSISASINAASPHQQHAQARIVVQRVERAGNILARLLVAAHHIDGDRQHVG